ncbi:hypothetical protein E4U56_001652 [Claviceps arundinis]|uniref:Uncharacterized protein n=1 Tax=Claviceps arundinis TaxID=1623583 RepID=A0A9P7SPB8_9HYPO|nr:hypothetical protein E4U56_001652 [Claviceps arundinis]
MIVINDGTEQMESMIMMLSWLWPIIVFSMWLGMTDERKCLHLYNQLLKDLKKKNIKKLDGNKK